MLLVHVTGIALQNFAQIQNDSNKNFSVIVTHATGQYSDNLKAEAYTSSNMFGEDAWVLR